MATPEQAQTEQDYADWEAEYATAQAAVQQAQADLEAAQEAADNATEAALSAAQTQRIRVIAPSTITQRKRKNWLSQTKLIKRALRFC